MEWLILLAAGGGAGAYAWARHKSARLARRERDEQLQQVRRLAAEDVTILGEQLTRLDEQLAGRDLDPESQQDYQAALDGYQRATREVPRMASVDDVAPLMETVTNARYAIVCVQARAIGREVPERRVPCFFNPQHGPSTTDVEWRFPRGGTRRYPVCRQCAARAAANEAPEVRTVQVGSRRVPYWEAGPTYLPYTQGYFDDAHAAGAAVAWVWAASVSHHAGGLGGFHGGPYGHDFGGGDGGGFDVGGAGDGGGGY